MKKLLYVCEADSGGIMEYAIRQSAALVNQGVEVHFLCKDSFPKERLAAGIVVEKFVEGRVASVQRRGLAVKLSTIWRLTLGQRRNSKRVAELAHQIAQTSSTRHPLPVTRHRPGPAEVCVLFACYKEYFAQFWVWPLKRLARRGVVIGTIAHDPVRDFVVGPLWWHRWSVRLGYSFLRHVFLHDDTPVDFGGKRPEGIQVHQIPHGPYDVAEPKIGRVEMRKRFGFDSVLTIEDTETTEDEDKDLSHGGTANTEQAEAGMRLCSQTGASESDSLASELADSPASESHTRSASGPAVALRADYMGSESAEGNQLADSMEILEGQSQAGLQMDSPKIQSIRVANNPGASEENSSSVFIREIRGQKTSGAPEALSLDSSAPADFVFLAFGQIRDGKNLDLFLRAMTHLPKHVKLLVAGKGDSGSSRPPEFYQNLAEELGVADRCRWDIRRIPEDEVGDIFAACDVVLVTYSAKFRSASGVLNAAVSARKQILASSGPGPLKKVVEKYSLGVFVEPDDVEEIVRGASKLVPSSATDEPATRYQLPAIPAPAWERYECENSWEMNARRVFQAFES